MIPLRKFIALPAKEKGLIIGVVPMVVGVRVALAVLPYRTVRAGLERFQASRGWSRRSALRPESLPARRRRILTAVEVVSRHLLGDKPCLTQALVAQCLLGRTGFDTTLCFGVAKDDEAFRAHAWLEREGHVVIGGGASPSRYRSLTPVQPDAL